MFSHALLTVPQACCLVLRHIEAMILIKNQEFESKTTFVFQKTGVYSSSKVKRDHNFQFQALLEYLTEKIRGKRLNIQKKALNRQRTVGPDSRQNTNMI